MTEILKTVKVPLGGGKMEASLFDLMPKRCVDDFVDTGEDLRMICEVIIIIIMYVSIYDMIVHAIDKRSRFKEWSQ